LPTWSSAKGKTAGLPSSQSSGGEAPSPSASMATFQSACCGGLLAVARGVDRPNGEGVRAVDEALVGDAGPAARLEAAVVERALEAPAGHAARQGEGERRRAAAAVPLGPTRDDALGRDGVHEPLDGVTDVTSTFVRLAVMVSLWCPSASSVASKASSHAWGAPPSSRQVKVASRSAWNAKAASPVATAAAGRASKVRTGG
jgi:hypothetical protein